jgi:hypothetical protein
MMSFNDSQNKKKLTGSHPGLTWSRVNPPGRPGFPGPILEWVFASTRTGPRPGSTHRARPGFKTLIHTYHINALIHGKQFHLHDLQNHVSFCRINKQLQSSDLLKKIIDFQNKIEQ